MKQVLVYIRFGYMQSAWVVLKKRVPFCGIVTLIVKFCESASVITLLCFIHK